MSPWASAGAGGEMERGAGGAGRAGGLLCGVPSHPGGAVWDGCIIQRGRAVGEKGLVYPDCNRLLQYTLLGGPSIFASLGAGEKWSLARTNLN